MRRLDRILAVLDPTAQAQPALAKAARLAAAAGSALELFISDYEPALANPRFFKSDRLQALREEFLARHRTTLERHAVALRGQGLTVGTEVRWATPVHAGIVARTLETAPDLVVKDTHYHGPIRRTVLTNTDWNLIRSCPAPLLLAKAAPWREPVRILAAVDPGHDSDLPAQLDHELLETGGSLAARLGGELHVVHAFFPAELIASTATMAAMPAVDGGTIVELLEQERGRIRAALAALLREHAIAPGRLQFRQGSAVEVLCDTATDLPADIMVLGAIARGRIREMVVGSTAERVLDRIACDILVVKPPGSAPAPD
jgi:universal stress protein E